MSFHIWNIKGPLHFDFIKFCKNSRLAVIQCHNSGTIFHMWSNTELVTFILAAITFMENKAFWIVTIFFYSGWKHWNIHRNIQNHSTLTLKSDWKYRYLAIRLKKRKKFTSTESRGLKSKDYSSPFSQNVVLDSTYSAAFQSSISSHFPSGSRHTSQKWWMQCMHRSVHLFVAQLATTSVCAVLAVGSLNNVQSVPRHCVGTDLEMRGHEPLLLESFTFCIPTQQSRRRTLFSSSRWHFHQCLSASTLARL